MSRYSYYSAFFGWCIISIIFRFFFCMTLNTNKSWQGYNLFRLFNNRVCSNGSWITRKYLFPCDSLLTAILFKIILSAIYDQMVVINLPISFLLLFNTIKLPSKGICREVIGIASLTLCWNTVSESSTVTPEIVSLNYIFSDSLFSFNGHHGIKNTPLLIAYRMSVFVRTTFYI